MRSSPIQIKHWKQPYPWIYVSASIEVEINKRDWVVQWENSGLGMQMIKWALEGTGRWRKCATLNPNEDKSTASLYGRWNTDMWFSQTCQVWPPGHPPQVKSGPAARHGWPAWLVLLYQPVKYSVPPAAERAWHKRRKPGLKDAFSRRRLPSWIRFSGRSG